MNLQTLENRKAELEQELATKQALQRVESNLADVEQKIRAEEKRRYSLRQDWLNRMSEQQQKRLQAEHDERELLSKINEVLLPLLEQLADARTRKTDSMLSVIGIFESEHTRHNFNRDGTMQHFYDCMKEIGVDVKQFPQWAAKRRLHGQFFRSEYESPNVGPLAHAINEAVAAVSKK